MPSEQFSERSFHYRNTKLLCPGAHGLQPALTVNDSGDAVLKCGCTRPELLPLKETRFSVEQFSRFVPESALASVLFPGSQWDEQTSSWRHPE